MIEVLYDYQAFLKNYGGISRYFSEIITGIVFSNNFKSYPKNYYSQNIHLFEKNLTKYDSLIRLKSFKGKKRIEGYLYQKELNKIQNKLMRGNFGVFHPTYYNDSFLKYIHPNKPFVVTVHDMIHELYYDKKFGNLFNESTYKSILIPRATHIITVSENTKKDLLSFYPGIDEKKISVVHHGSSLSMVEQNIDLPQLYSNYLLFVGDRKYYKNFTWFIKSVSSFLRLENVNLVCAGGGSFDDHEIQLIKDENILDNVFYTNINNDKELISLYKNAYCFIFPSLIEGFGMPILEAFSCGCPVVLPKSSCFPEIAGQAAQYYEPNDPLGLVQKVREIISEKSLAEKLINKGFIQVRKYSWETSIEKHKMIYEAVC